MLSPAAVSDRLTPSPGVLPVEIPRIKKLFGAFRQCTVAGWGLGLMIVLAIFLRFYRLGSYGVGNAYYAATVQSMLTSWHNFFFASCEPGGSVTVDKPPLGFWVQAASAYVLGVNGFALALPQALAGVLSVPLLYAIVKRQWGVGAGLIAAAALATMPVAVAVERSNAVDGLLTFVLLWATWAFLRAARQGRFRDLLYGVVLVGLGFNIKMMQALMPLPAFYLLYFLGAPHRWRKKVAYLAAATVVLMGVSLSWALAVDLTPADRRPYIGGSGNNTVLGLIIGHNALTRLGLSTGPVSYTHL
ncbi:MAG: glycosyltransferase family 39 protein, partial [Anaerolineae bacterium]|nr:glycosyltransferase family 39 protein [Anaerolineae bacterium]